MDIRQRIPGVRPGHWIVECDRCGREIWSDEARKTWDGLLVCVEDWEPRHPQEMIKGRADRQSVPNPGSEPADAFTGNFSTPLTANAASGATSLTVSSTTNFVAGHRVMIMLNSGALHHTTIVSVDSAVGLTITTGLAGAAASGNIVTDLGSA